MGGSRLTVEKKFGGATPATVPQDAWAQQKLQAELTRERQLPDGVRQGSQKEREFLDEGYVRLHDELEEVAAPLKLSPMEMDLYRRRHTSRKVNIHTGGMSTEFDRIVEKPVTDPRLGLKPRLSRMERKKLQGKVEEEEKSKYDSALEQVTTQFANAEVLRSEWFSRNVLKKEIEIEHADKSKEKMDQDELLKRVMTGNYENLEQLDPVLRNMAAKSYMEQIRIVGLGGMQPADMINALFNQGGVAALMNPLFRVGLSLLAKGATLSKGAFAGCSAADCAEMEDLCNQRIMSSTLYTVAQKDEANGIGDDELKRNQESQIFIAKTLLAAHMGKMQRIDLVGEEKKKSAWGHGMATAFAHCSRVAFTLPGDKKTTDAMCGKEHGLQAGFFRRRAATHKLSKKRKGKEGSELIEKKSWGTLYGQQGMNVAVGGLGNDGVAGDGGRLRKLKNDGSCGHIYMHVNQGGAFAYTGLLVGFESDAPGVMNMTGHRHGMGNPEFASSFGGMRTDEIGEKYGGRVVDLSGVGHEKFEKSMQKLEQRMTELYDKVRQGDETAQAELMHISDLLSGKQLTDAQISEILNGFTGDLAFEGKIYKSVESYTLARKVAEAKDTPEKLRTPEMIKAVAQDFAENFAKELPDLNEKKYDPLVMRGNSIGSLDTLNKVIKALVPPDVFVNVIRQLEKETGGEGAMHNFAKYYVYLKGKQGTKLDKPIEQLTPEQIEKTEQQLDKVFSVLGGMIQTDQLGQLLSGALKAFTDKGMSAEEASMWMMNNAMLRCGALNLTMQKAMKDTGIDQSNGWDENMTDTKKEGFDILNAMKMLMDHANTLLKLTPEERDRNPFHTAASRRLASTAAAQQPAN